MKCYLPSLKELVQHAVYAHVKRAPQYKAYSICIRRYLDSDLDHSSKPLRGVSLASYLFFETYKIVNMRPPRDSHIYTV